MASRRLFSLLLLIVSLWTTSVQSLDSDPMKCNSIRNEDRIDCNPDPPISKEICEQRGCCWNAGNNTDDDGGNLISRALPHLGVPSCYYGENYIGYKIEKIYIKDEDLSMTKLKRVRPSGFPKDIENVNIEIHQLNDQVLRLKFIDANQKRYEVPTPKLNIPSVSKSSNSRLYSTEISGSHLIVRRRETNQSIFDINLAQMVYSDQLIHLTSKLPSKYIYGIGEHREPFRKTTDWKRYTQWTRDQVPISDHALYGSHPFYMMVENKTKLASGVFLFNSNAMDILTQPSPAITFRTVGGILDFFIFFGPKPEQVVQQYHNLIGLPAMPPFWSLGYQQCRYGYNNFTNLNQTYWRTRQAGIPMDVQWTDIDMFDSYNDFTYNHKQFKELPDFIRNVLHKNGQKFIPMFDCGISSGETAHSYRPYDYGVELDIFVKNSSKQIFNGKVWNGKSTVWPDFSHPNATKYWSKMFEEYHKIIEFDGAWIDMNEPSNFYDGQIDGCPKTEIENPQYVPGMTDDSLTLRHKTLCMTARHYNDQLHYNLHNLYGFQEAIATNEALKTTLNKRPFIISRSSAPGHGHWASHWDGDVISDWSSMRWTIPSILNFNLFGVPMIGADICGFIGDTTVELCRRWYQLGAFYSFVRNHNVDNAIDQDPVALGETVVRTARSALIYRYVFLPYLYTLFYNVHQNGGTVLRPMFFEFPDDDHLYDIETQFMWGDSMLIAPILYPNQTENKVYLPKGTWHNMGQTFESQGQYFTIKDSLDDINYVFFRSGSIIPMQEPQNNTEMMKSKDFGLVVILDPKNPEHNAKGSLYLDSGDSLDPVKKGEYNFYNFEVKNNTLTIESQHLGYQTNQSIIVLEIFGIDRKPTSIIFDGKPYYQFIYTTNNMLIIQTKLSIYNNDNDDKSKKIHYQFEWKFN
ncbi:LOW QUALITY PROTEIN: lysosomal alpha-glucosidase-like [Dermatophagoides pteronyssinus]|uniref:LOW QUALITY PROTEIN: lysosomal alpha-glucosidase-like n=1 Tax=Dermatophagoides pteronyssinus TaxID=6956 RepID=UPI003F668528